MGKRQKRYRSKGIKKEIKSKAIEEIIYPIYRPYKHQKMYLDNLFNASEAMKNVRCVNHPDETIDDMGVECYSEFVSVPTLKACCKDDQKVKTTFYTYSWRTGETLASGIPLTNNKREVPRTCDFKNCGCLTHLHDGNRIGKRSCKKYGENANSLQR